MSISMSINISDKKTPESVKRASAVISLLSGLGNAGVWSYVIKATSDFSRAVDKDPSLGPAGIGVGFLMIFMAFYGWILPAIGLFSGILGKKSAFKKIAQVGIILSVCGFVLYAGLWVFYLVGVMF